MRLVLVAGSTDTAGIDGISAAGATVDQRRHTPAADLEIVAYGRPIAAPVVPVSPDGCPTPAALTRSAIELVDVPTVALDAGMEGDTAAPTVDIGNQPGRNVRESTAVPNAAELYDGAREYAAALPDDRIVVGETIPAGTTTALGVLTALGERETVSSSLPENPIALKRETVDTGLAASDLEPGDVAGDPIGAVEAMGDPVLAAVAGLIEGAVDGGTAVTLGGGTQMAAATALARHADVDADLRLATTSFLAADPDADVTALVADLDLDLVVTDPHFDAVDHPAADAYHAGVAKEGVGAGGALALADERAVDPTAVRDRFLAVTDRLLEITVEGAP